jgi:polysaccharide deacetylase family protein (PEP-CTERM system associated)
MLNAISVDVEDYFHVEAFAKTIATEQWAAFQCRVEKNVDLILELMARHGTRATFFVLGWVAEKVPRLVPKIAGAGHEIGCHGYAHQHIGRQTPEVFRQDLRKAIQLLAGQAQKPILSYRAPTFSITRKTLWAMEILVEEGIRIDSSIFPVHHDLYGMPESDRFPHWRGKIFEFPPASIRIAGRNFGVAGGGYLRLLPYGFTRRVIRNINDAEHQPAMVYFHPWELDPDQPRIVAPLRSRLRHYTNLRGMQKKIERLLEDFRFGTVVEVCEHLMAKNPDGLSTDRFN